MTLSTTDRGVCCAESQSCTHLGTGWPYEWKFRRSVSHVQQAGIGQDEFTETSRDNHIEMTAAGRGVWFTGQLTHWCFVKKSIGMLGKTGSKGSCRHAE